MSTQYYFLKAGSLHAFCNQIQNKKCKKETHQNWQLNDYQYIVILSIERIRTDTIHNYHHQDSLSFDQGGERVWVGTSVDGYIF